MTRTVLTPVGVFNVIIILVSGFIEIDLFQFLTLDYFLSRKDQLYPSDSQKFEHAGVCAADSVFIYYYKCDAIQDIDIGK